MTKSVVNRQGRLPNARAKGGASSFSVSERAGIKSIAGNDLTPKDFAFADSQRAVALRASKLSIATVAKLFHAVQKSGAGLICWRLHSADMELSLHFTRLAWPKQSRMPALYAGPMLIREANTVLFSNGHDVVCCLFSGRSFDFRSLTPFLRSEFRFDNLEPMPDGEDQIALLGRSFEDAKVLVERYAAQSQVALRDAATIAIVFALEECQAGRAAMLDHIVQMAKGELTASGKRKKKKRQLPSLPDGYHWPVGKFADSTEAGKHGGLARYLDEVWRPLISAGLVNRSLLRLADDTLDRAISKYQYNNGRGIRALPQHLTIPLKMQKPLAPSKKLRAHSQGSARLPSPQKA